VAAGLFFSHGTQGSLLLQDGFNYTSGGALAGNGAWVNSYSLITVGSGSLTYFGLLDTAPSGNEAAVAANPNAGTSSSPFWTASTFGTAASSGTVYASFLLNYTVMTSPANYTFMGMLPTAGNGGNFIAANDPIDLAEHSNASGTGYTLGIRTYGQSATYYGTNGAWNDANAPVLSLNTNHLIVIKYDFSAKKASLFINPPLTGTEGTAIATTAASATAAADLGQIYLRAAGNIAAGGSVASPPYLVDTIRVGSTWAGVMPLAPVPAAARLGFTTVPLAGTVGATLYRVVVQAQDASTNNVATNNVPITVSLNAGSFAGGTTVAHTDATGKAAFTNLVINTPGTYTMTASASGIGVELSSAASGPFAIGPTNAIGEQAQALLAFLDSLRVEQYWARGVSVNWLTGAAGGSGSNITKGTASHCSAFASGAADVLGVYLLQPPQAGDQGLANIQADWLATSPAGWYAVPSMTNAQHLANLGTLVVASYKEPDGSPGHIAIIRSSTRSDVDVQAYGPQECQSGVNNYNSTNVMAGFDQHDYAFPDGIRYYGHALTSPILPVNPVFGAHSLSNGVFRVNVTNIIGRRYTFQCTSNFVTWSNVLTYTNSNGGSNFFCVTPLTNSPGAGSALRFYRLLAQ
jgi:hypothetical protein